MFSSHPVASATISVGVPLVMEPVVAVVLAEHLRVSPGAMTSTHGPGPFILRLPSKAWTPENWFPPAKDAYVSARSSTDFFVHAAIILYVLLPVFLVLAAVPSCARMTGESVSVEIPVTRTISRLGSSAGSG